MSRMGPRQRALLAEMLGWRKGQGWGLLEYEHVRLAETLAKRGFLERKRISPLRLTMQPGKKGAGVAIYLFFFDCYSLWRITTAGRVALKAKRVQA